MIRHFTALQSLVLSRQLGLPFCEIFGVTLGLAHAVQAGLLSCITAVGGKKLLRIFCCQPNMLSRGECRCLMGDTKREESLSLTQHLSLMQQGERQAPGTCISSSRVFLPCRRTSRAFIPRSSGQTAAQFLALTVLPQDCAALGLCPTGTFALRHLCQKGKGIGRATRTAHASASWWWFC